MREQYAAGAAEFPNQNRAPSDVGESAMRTSLLLLLISVSEGALTRAGELQLNACLPQSLEIPSHILRAAQGYAMRIYQQIGVELRWKGRCRTTPAATAWTNLQVVGMDWATHAPGSIGSRARASAYLFRTTGPQIVLYLDRILPILLLHPNVASALLGHILAHEIGHVVMQNPRHAEIGLMKASWTTNDESDMRVRLLTFDHRDAVVIRDRLQQPEPVGDFEHGPATKMATRRGNKQEQ